MRSFLLLCGILLYVFRCQVAMFCCERSVAACYACSLTSVIIITMTMFTQGNLFYTRSAVINEDPVAKTMNALQRNFYNWSKSGQSKKQKQISF